MRDLCAARLFRVCFHDLIIVDENVCWDLPCLFQVQNINPYLSPLLDIWLIDVIIYVSFFLSLDSPKGKRFPPRNAKDSRKEVRSRRSRSSAHCQWRCHSNRFCSQRAFHPSQGAQCYVRKDSILFLVLVMWKLNPRKGRICMSSFKVAMLCLE